MNPLHEDPNFAYELLRSIGLVRYGCGDVGEQLAIIPSIKVNDPESWYAAWDGLAKRALSTIDNSVAMTGKPSNVTLRDVYLKVSHYLFERDFFIHNNWSDPRLYESWKLWRMYFDKANELLPSPGQHVKIETPHGFWIPAIIYRTQVASGPRPTIIVGGGFDSNYEECFHNFGLAALERGINVVLYEGPGQPSLIHGQNKGFIHDWEKAVTPIVDYIASEQKQGNLDFIDFKKIGLIGLSLGGYLSARAAAFEPRLAAVMCIDGVWSFNDCLEMAFPDAVKAFEKGDVEVCNAAFEKDFDKKTATRWIHDHSLYSFQKKTAYEMFEESAKMTLANGVAQKIQIPALIGEAEGDLFFGTQPRQVHEAIKQSDLFFFGKEHAANEHCQSGADVYLNQKVFDWFEHVINK